MEVNFSGRIPRLSAAGLPRKVFVASDAARSLERVPNADVFTRASASPLIASPSDSVLDEIARCNALVLNKPEHPHPFMDIQDFLATMAPFEHKVVGALPDSIKRFFPDKPSEAITFLGELATFLRTDDGLRLCSSHPLKLSSGRKFNAKYLDCGQFANVFKVGDAKNEIALKVFKEVVPQRHFLEHGPIAEARTDAYLADAKYKDFRTFYVADFSKKGKWSLSEFIPTPEDLTEIRALYKVREGVALRSVHSEVCFSDFHITRNYLLDGQVRVDPGGGNIPTKCDESSKELLAAKYPDLFSSTPIVYDKSVSGVKELPQEQRLPALESLITNSDPKIRHLFSDVIRYLPHESRTKAYYALLNHPDPAFKVELGDQARFLLYDDAPKALKAAIEHPDAQVNTDMLDDVKELLHPDEQAAMKAKIMKKILAPYSTFSL